jgi:hypothetical protein
MNDTEYNKNDAPEKVSSADNRKTKFLDRIIKFYTAKVHIVMIIVELVVGSVELNYGVTYNNQCPIQQMIGPFLITHGATTIFSGLLILLAVVDARIVYVRSKKTTARLIIFILFLIMVILNMFFFAWFVAGNIWVFGAKANGVQGTDSTNLTTYCQPDMYRAAIVLIIARYIVIPIVIIISIAVHFCKSSKGQIS